MDETSEIGPIVDQVQDNNFEVNTLWPFKREPHQKESVDTKSLTPLINDNEPPLTTIHPLKSVVTINHGERVVLDDKINKLFFDLASQHTIEADSIRTNYLQSLLDKFCELNGLHTKIYILQRGTDPNAFAMADGSLFILQSLIDKADSLDELIGVIGHELGHIKYNTFENKISSHDPLSTGWLHEGASDSLAPELLESLGLNSTALNTILKKLPQGRDYKHQTSSMRATENIGLHTGIDYETSSTTLTELPDFVKGSKATPTNRELIGEALKEENLLYVSENLDFLYPSDLKFAFDEALSPSTRGKYWNSREKRLLLPEIYYDNLRTFHSYFEKRLLSLDFSSQDIKNFLFLRSAPPYEEFCDFSYLKSPQELVTVFDNLPHYSNENTDDIICKSIFGSKDIGFPPIQRSLSTLLENYYNPEKTNNEHKIPLTPQVMVDILKVLHERKSESFGIDSLLSDNIITYIEKEFTKSTGKTAKVKNNFGEIKKIDILQLEKEQAKNFLILLQNNGVAINKDHFKTHKYDDQMPSLFENDTNFLLSNEIRNLINEVIGAGEVEYDETKELDTDLENFISTFCSNLPKNERLTSASNFMNRLIYYTENLPDAEKVSTLEKIFEKLDNFDFSTLDQVPTEEWCTPELKKYSIKELLILATFETDSDEFYQLFEKTMINSEINLSSLDLAKLINLSTNLLNPESQLQRAFYLMGSYNGGPLSENITIQISDYSRYSELPHLRAIAQRTLDNLNSVDDINYAMKTEKEKSFTWQNTQGNIYDSSFFQLLIGKNYREAFEKIVSRGIDDEDPNQLAAFISRNFPDSPTTTQLLRLIDFRSLNLNTNLDEKIIYLNDQFDRIGLDGMVIVAESISNLEDYERFHEIMGRRLETYLSGSKTISRLAIADNASSILSAEHYNLFGTTRNDSKSKVTYSTSFAKTWLRTWLNRIYSDKKIVSYAPEDEMFHVDITGRQIFRSFSDTITTLQQMTEGQRVALALKSLVDLDGALTDDMGKKDFSSNVIKSLDIHDNFVKQAISLGVEKAPPEFIGLPAARMVAPLLFRGLDLQFVDYQDLQPRKGVFGFGKDRFSLSTRQIYNMLNSKTRDIVWFGRDKTEDPTSLIAKLTYDSDDSFRFVNDELERALQPDPDFISDQYSTTSEDTSNASAESVIRAVESSGALGVRSLQLSRQLYHFSPEIDARLAKSFDTNKGLNKLLFWENIHRITTQDENGTAKFIQEHLQSIDEFLGGGSLYTTFAATISTSETESKEVVFKILNPNPELFINTSYQTAIDVLSEIQKGKDKKSSDLATLGKVFVDLSKEWCLADINDTEFETDDDDFRGLVERLNQRLGTEVFFVPQRHYNSFRLKCEEKANGRTLNKILADKSIDPQIKSDLISNIKALYKFQLTQAARSSVGENTFIVHSDPHIGNFVIDLESSSNRIGIIDRSMYLKLSETQAQMFADLLESGNYRVFVNEFLEEVVDSNKVHDVDQREAKKSSVFSDIRKEYIKQRLSSIATRKEPDNLSILRKLMSALENQNLNVPLSMRLMIRNIQSIRELEKRYSL